MTFADSFSYCLTNYFTISARGSRSEYWWFILGSVLAGFLGSIADVILGFKIVGPLISLALFIPTITAGTRRLHDTDRSGWWQLILFIPVLGGILLLVWFASRGTVGRNRFGPPPPGDDFHLSFRA